MNFKQWFLTEVGNILNRDVSSLQLMKTSTGYEYKFEINGLDYQVIIKHYNMDFWTETIPSFLIGFKGPEEYAATGLAGTAANVIYTQLLLAIKKLFEVEEVNALVFSGYESAMDVVYQRFFKQYLAKDFVHAANNFYIRKSYLRDIIANYSDDRKQNVYRDILDQRRDMRKMVKSTLKRKQQKRNNMLLIKQSIGTFVYYKNPYTDALEPAYIMSYNRAEDEVHIIFSRKGVIDARNYRSTDFDFSNKVNETEIDEFLRNVAIKSNSTPWFRQSYIMSAECQPLRTLMDQRNLKY